MNINRQMDGLAKQLAPSLRDHFQSRLEEFSGQVSNCLRVAIEIQVKLLGDSRPTAQDQPKPPAPVALCPMIDRGLDEIQAVVTELFDVLTEIHKGL